MIVVVGQESLVVDVLVKLGRDTIYGLEGVNIGEDHSVLAVAYDGAISGQRVVDTSELTKTKLLETGPSVGDGSIPRTWDATASERREFEMVEGLCEGKGDEEDGNEKKRGDHGRERRGGELFGIGRVYMIALEELEECDTTAERRGGLVL